MRRLNTAERWVIIIGLTISVTLLTALLREQRKTVVVKLGVTTEKYDTLKFHSDRNLDSLFKYKRLYKKCSGK